MTVSHCLEIPATGPAHRVLKVAVAAGLKGVTGVRALEAVLACCRLLWDTGRITVYNEHATFPS